MLIDGNIFEYICIIHKMQYLLVFIEKLHIN